VEQSAVQHRLKHAPQALQLESVSRSELNVDPTVFGLRPGERQAVSATSMLRTDNPSEVM
jgi:hypothetical protein